MKALFVIALLLHFHNVFSQISYKGSIGPYPVEFVINTYSDGDTRAVYCYDKHDSPIILVGRNDKGVLALLERNAKGNTQAVLKFENFDVASTVLSGVWANQDSTKVLQISLRKQFEVSYKDKTIWANREMIQSQATRKNYFRLLISKKSTTEEARVTGVKVFEKATDHFLQQFDLDCSLNGFENISVGDYNFETSRTFQFLKEAVLVQIPQAFIFYHLKTQTNISSAILLVHRSPPIPIQSKYLNTMNAVRKPELWRRCIRL